MLHFEKNCFDVVSMPEHEVRKKKMVGCLVEVAVVRRGLNSCGGVLTTGSYGVSKLEHALALPELKHARALGA